MSRRKGPLFGHCQWAGRFEVSSPSGALDVLVVPFEARTGWSWSWSAER